MPFFSIIIPTYNRATFLPKAIESVLCQSFIDWELLVINDGSEDNTEEIVYNFDDKRIRYFYQANADRSVARNNGIRNALGNYIFFLDSDDYMIPEFLNKIYNAIVIENGQNKLFFCSVLQKIGDHITLLHEEPSNKLEIIKYILEKNKVIQVSQLVIPRNFLQNNHFNERFTLWEDTHLFLRLLAQYEYKSVGISGVIMQKHEYSTVAIGMAAVKLKDVDRYVDAVLDLSNNYSDLFQEKANQKDFRNYIDSKLNMYLYQSRINNQFKIAYRIVRKILQNKLSLNNVIITLKLPIHNFFYLIKNIINR